MRPFLRAVRLFGQDERMAARAFLETILTVALTLFLSASFIAVWSLIDGSTLTEAIESGVRTASVVLYPLAVVAIGWLIVNLAAKRSSSTARFWFNMLVLFLVSLLAAAIWWVLFVLLVGGFGALVGIIGVGATVGFLVAGALALVLVHFVFFRRRNVEAPVTAVALPAKDASV